MFHQLVEIAPAGLSESFVFAISKALIACKRPFNCNQFDTALLKEFTSTNFTDRLAKRARPTIFCVFKTCLMLWSDKVEHFAFPRLHNLCTNNCDSHKQRTSFSSWSNNSHMFASDKNILRLTWRIRFIINDTNRWCIGTVCSFLPPPRNWRKFFSWWNSLFALSQRNDEWWNDWEETEITF